MHWQGFYVDPEQVGDETLVFLGEEVRHLSRSLRKKSGDRVWAVDGRGGAYEVELTSFSKDSIKGRIITRRRRLGEAAAEVTLALGLLKGDRFDQVVEKATELGVARIVPVESRYTEAGAGRARLNRWRRIVRGAMKQSGRCIEPEIMPVQSFQRVAASGVNSHLRLLAEAEDESAPVLSFFPLKVQGTPHLLLLVGPEGGFSQEEVEEAREQGFNVVSLGPRRLRADTAAITLLVQVLAGMEELQ